MTSVKPPKNETNESILFWLSSFTSLTTLSLRRCSLNLHSLIRQLRDDMNPPCLPRLTTLALNDMFSTSVPRSPAALAALVVEMIKSRWWPPGEAPSVAQQQRRASCLENVTLCSKVLASNPDSVDQLCELRTQGLAVHECIDCIQDQHVIVSSIRVNMLKFRATTQRKTRPADC